MNSQIKPEVRTTSTRMQYNVELFLSRERGHSPERRTKLLGRELRSDFHHNQTTPLSKGLRVFFGFYRFQFRIQKNLVFHRKQLSNLSDNAPRALEIMFV
ncbi:hypothetical protein MTR67_017720 [Solanum verrucosum]|uniref:Uncharacterized protein n=1 Tax=Solanum verrucosum TaxID=315347 RepID=A0AAF0QL25_SOLVR|nr:hypothetical protein MTR67_017720 [Solanum verrucosum]